MRNGVKVNKISEMINIFEELNTTGASYTPDMVKSTFKSIDYTTK